MPKLREAAELQGGKAVPFACFTVTDKPGVHLVHEVEPTFEILPEAHGTH